MAQKIDKATRDAIAAQCLEEIQFARNARQIKVKQWWKNEDLYYSKKVVMDSNSERANVNLNEAQSFVQTFLSKINTDYNFKYIKGDEADLKAAKIANALKDKDFKLGRWSFKAMIARVQLIIYGRYIFEYHADSVNGYRSHLTPVDVYQFLIDPSCGGLDIEKAFYLGRGGIIKSKKDLEEGIKSGKYLRTETKELISGTGNYASETPEDVNAMNRWTALLSQQKLLVRADEWKFWEWNTTYKGKRYTVLITEDGGKMIKCDLHKDLFKSDKWQFFSAAAYPDLTEFWTPSPLDGVRETIMAKSTAINQMLDNGEAINRPMKAFDVGAVKNPALLKYRKDGLMPVKSGTKISDAIQFFPASPITTAKDVYDKLSEITAVNSGVSDATKGQAEEEAVGIYQGNMAAEQNRFSLIGDSEADAQQRFAELYLDGLDEHLTTKVAIEMIGIEGIEYKEVTRKDLKRNRDFEIMVITPGQEEQMNTIEKKNKLTFLSGKSADISGTYNKKVLAEMEAAIAGFSPDEIKYMLDTKNDGNTELMAECAEDIKALLQGEDIPLNEEANTAYQQKFRDYMKDNSEYMLKHPETAARMMNYLMAINPIVIANMNKALDIQLAAEGLPSMAGQAAGIPSIPAQPGTPGVEEAQVSKAVQQSTLQNYGK